MRRPEVSVVIPYFDDQQGLHRLLRALDQQRGDIGLEVVVADDGSPEPPVVPDDLGFGCAVVRQQNLGFRAAAARNLGADAATGELLIFLDGDTLPAATYLAAITGTLRAIDDAHGALVVGRRRHADFRSADDATILAFLRDEPAGPSSSPPGSAATVSAPAEIGLLPDPQWLLDGYARTDKLRSAGDEDFRLVISAVLGVDRRLWEATGGFDSSFVGYGGEDWDFGWRAWLSGADLAHEPLAVGWHDGPDAAGRGPAGRREGRLTKNAESLRLAQRIALPSVRGTGLVLDQPEIVIRYLGPTTGDAGDAAAVACVAGLLDGSDAAVWFPGCSADLSAAGALPPVLRGDPRVHAGEVPGAVLDRARFQVWVERPVRLTVALHQCCVLGEWAVPGGIRCRRTRALRRQAPFPTRIPAELTTEFAVHDIPFDVSLERWWAGW